MEGVVLAELSVIEGEYLRDILDQGRALEDTLVGLKGDEQLHSVAVDLQRDKFRSLVLTGMGASFYALHPIHLNLLDHGFTAMMVETSELVHYESRLFTSETLIIAVSQSGQSAEVVRLLQA